MPEWLMQALGYLGGLAVLYAGIRADLARLHEKAERGIVSGDRANLRIDQYLNRGNAT